MYTVGMKNSRGGFTLIELLVVIAVIGILAAVILASLNGARAKARDARRMSDMSEIVKALELYYHDNGYYPPSPCGWDCNGYATSGNATWDALTTALSPYIKLPVDPINTSNGDAYITGQYVYSYGNVGRTTQRVQYDLTAQLETASPYRCSVKQYRYDFNNILWCGSFSGQIYEASPN
jgi:type II secretion system protein G